MFEAICCIRVSKPPGSAEWRTRVNCKGVKNKGEPTADQTFGMMFGALKVWAEARRAKESRIHAEYMNGKERMGDNKGI